MQPRVEDDDRVVAQMWVPKVLNMVDVFAHLVHNADVVVANKCQRKVTVACSLADPVRLCIRDRE